jgi:hypothetical protein
VIGNLSRSFFTEDIGTAGMHAQVWRFIVQGFSRLLAETNLGPPDYDQMGCGPS